MNVLLWANHVRVVLMFQSIAVVMHVQETIVLQKKLNLILMHRLPRPPLLLPPIQVKQRLHLVLLLLY